MRSEGKKGVKKVIAKSRKIGDKRGRKRCGGEARGLEERVRKMEEM